VRGRALPEACGGENRERDGGQRELRHGQKNSILNKTPRAHGGQRELSVRQSGQRELSARRGKTELKRKPSIRLGARDDSSSSLHDGSSYDSSIRLHARVWGAKRTERAAGWAKRTEHVAGRNLTKEETINKTGHAR
jgi:hypothetical protein